MSGAETTGVHILRLVHEDSKPSLAFVGGLSEHFPETPLEIRPPDTLWATLISKSITRSALRDNPGKQIEQLVHPLPRSGRRLLELPVTAVEYLGNREDKTWLALVLEDPQGIFGREFTILKERLGRAGRNLHEGRPVTPHVSLAHLALEHTSDDLLRWVDARKPQAIKLEPLTTSPFVPAPPIVPPWPVVHSTSKPLDTPIRVITIAPQPSGNIPPGLKRQSSRDD